MTLRKLAVATFALSVTLSASGTPKLFTTDPLTNLPVHPATDSRFHLGNDPTRLPDSQYCKSKMQVDFYTVYDTKVEAVVAWYSARLNGFKKAHGYFNKRSKDIFYSADGTMIVDITGSIGAPGESTDTYSLSFLRFQPGIPEKTILGMIEQKVLCP